MDNTTRMGSVRPNTYTIRLRRVAGNGSVTGMLMTSAEIDRLTPPGMKITAPLDEMISVLAASMQNIKRQNHSVCEEISSVRLQQVN